MNNEEKKTFGRHIEYVFDRIHTTIIDLKDHELESIKLGLLTDQEKLKFLKQDLYRAVRGRGNPEYLAELRSAIATIETSIQARYQRDNDFIGKFNQVFNTAILLLVCATLASYFTLGVCGDSKKPICANTSQLARYFNKQFSDPQ